MYSAVTNYVKYVQCRLKLRIIVRVPSKITDSVTLPSKLRTVYSTHTVVNITDKNYTVPSKITNVSYSAHNSYTMKSFLPPWLHPVPPVWHSLPADLEPPSHHGGMVTQWREACWHHAKMLIIRSKLSKTYLWQKHATDWTINLFQVQPNPLRGFLKELRLLLSQVWTSY